MKIDYIGKDTEGLITDTEYGILLKTKRTKMDTGEVGGGGDERDAKRKKNERMEAAKGKGKHNTKSLFSSVQKGLSDNQLCVLHILRGVDLHSGHLVDLLF
ncbi:hypothetical protein QE152_g31246 [Popillia japonica]|uniref:Uncharacterized protein n=1 Tax=Popillia japonica TaxID=7064 RepID=A0AAW1JAP4_POPJA